MESSQKKLLRNDTDSLKKPGSALLPGFFPAEEQAGGLYYSVEKGTKAWAALFFSR